MEENKQDSPGKANSKNDSMIAKSTMWVAVVLALLFAFPAGYVIGDMSDSGDPEIIVADVEEEVHEDHDDDVMAHMHDAYEVPGGAVAPSISMLTVTQDAKSGWNLHFMTDDFTFAPEHASGEHVDGEGHAHLYIDGEKITRLYSNSYYIEHMEEGEHTIRVTLNTNDHKEYVIDGEVIAASQEVVDSHHSGDDAMTDSHDTMHEVN